MQRRTMIRTIRAAAVVAAASLVLAGCSGGGTGDASGGASKEPVVIGSWGASFDEALKQAYFDDFTAETGIPVVIAPADWARFAAMNDAKASEWNSVDVSGALALEWAEAGYLQKLPEDVERSDMVNTELAEYSAGAYLNSFVIVYRPSAFSEKVDSWEDFWDTDTFPGKRAMVGTYEGSAEAALLADGVEPEELFPLDLDRAFAKLDELKPNLTFTEGYAELRQALETDQVDMAIIPSGSAAVVVNNNPGELEINWEDNILSEGAFPVSAYGPNQEGFAQLLTFMQDPKRQAEFSDISFYGSAMSEAFDLMKPETQAVVTTNPENLEKAVEPDYEWFAEHTDEYVDRFNEWLAQ